ncbi:MAG: putative type I restriction modification N-terminal methyltransferase domain protein [Gaeavirus sp.]|uniref:site-specific DNA-methyltransferase (adenine-specific) n=1 Tax=Gaeavirus sp. TaxID=2487767 RepID=A0A3G5A375_9VIRU|nr:MAG: putative type I restriction modification N-terminal methyltransferase domain protein [Gaeavirus sp.]
MSSIKYTCTDCSKVFNKKIDFTKHQNMEESCIKSDKIQKSSQSTESKVKPQVESKTESESKSPVESKTESESKTKSPVESKTESKTKSPVESKTESKTKSPVESKTKSPVESKTKSPVESKTKLSTIFNYCLDVLRNNEHLTGDKALRTLAHLLDLRLLEPQFGKQIDIDNYKYDFSQYEDNIIEKHKTKLLSMVRFSNLANEKEDNIPKIMKCLWDEILSVHPVTKNIFLKGKGFDIQHQSTYKKLIDKLYSFDFESIDEDILGEAYEEVIKDVMTGKVLGQFFTPPSVKHMMIKLINPQLKPNGTIEKIFDPAMGTGGFLISSLRHILQQSKTKGINLNWKFLSKEGLGGREAEPDTYQLAISNMLISSGHMFDVLEKGDSIRNPITNKYDIILANPPFGIDGLIYNEIQHPLRNEYLPIKSNSAVPLFLQAIIYMLKINGRCAVIVPCGKELYNSRKELVALREYLTKTCDLQEIYYLPQIFTHTTISTCVLYFTKKIEGTDALKTNIKISRTQTETAREYNFTEAHQTTKIKFYSYNPDNDSKQLLIEIPIDEISKNNYSLNHAEYIKDTMTDKFKDGIQTKKIIEICDFISGGKKRKPDDAITNGKYKFMTCSILGHSYLNTYDHEDKALIINSVNGSGRCMIYIAEKYSVGAANFHFKVKDNNIVLTEYIYYYLYHNLKLLEDGFFGANQKRISKKYLGDIRIPIPSLKHQQEIVKQCEHADSRIKQLESEIQQHKTQTHLFMSTTLKS